MSLSSVPMLPVPWALLDLNLGCETSKSTSIVSNDYLENQRILRLSMTLNMADRGHGMQGASISSRLLSRKRKTW